MIDTCITYLRSTCIYADPGVNKFVFEAGVKFLKNTHSFEDESLVSNILPTMKFYCRQDSKGLFSPGISLFELWGYYFLCWIFMYV